MTTYMRLCYVGAKSVGYVNVENSATVSDDYRYLIYSSHYH